MKCHEIRLGMAIGFGLLTVISLLPLAQAGGDDSGFGSARSPMCIIKEFNEPARSVETTRAPELALDSVAGDTIEFEGNRERPLVMVFWATWCPACEQQMPSVDELADDEQLAADVITVTIREGVDSREAVIERIEQYRDSHSVDYPVYFGSETVMEKFDVQPIPTTVVIDTENRLRFKGVGYHSPSVIRHIVSDVADAT